MNKRIIIFIITILLVSYISLFKFYIDSNNEKPKNNLINVNSNILKQSNIEKFIEENYIDNLDIFNSYFNNINNLSNDIKLKYSFITLLNHQKYKKNIDSIDLIKQIKTTFGSTISIQNEDIKFDKYIINYDKKNNVYTSNYNNQNDYLVIKKIIKYNLNNEKVTLKIYKFYVKNNKIYGSYEDMIKNYNVIYYVKNSSNVSKYIDDNFNEKNNKYQIYTYTFELENKKLILTSYKNQ